MSRPQRPYEQRYPYTLELLKSYNYTTDEEVDQALARSAQAFQAHSRLSLEERVNKVRKFGEAIQNKKQQFAEAITYSMGKTIGVSNMEVDITVACVNIFCDGAAKWLANEPIENVQGGRAYIRYDPHGIVLSIAPFNFPLFTAVQNSIGNVVAGNTAILKPEESCAAVGELLNEAAAEAGLADEYQVLFLTFAQVQKVINDRNVVGVSFTGSTMAGQAIAGMAAQACKKFCMELGGSDPMIILQDADIPYAVGKLIVGRCCAATGQICISPKRVFVHESMYDQFAEALVKALEPIVPGDPMNPENPMGPVARQDLLDNLVRQLNECRAQGARVLCGGNVIDKLLLEPTVLVDTNTDMTCFREELFGPIISLFKYSTEEEVIELANDTQYGLGAMIFTSNPQRARDEIAPRIDAGGVYINQLCMEMPLNTPFGGIKKSGIGRVNAEHGLKEHVLVKTVFVADS